MSEQNVFPSPEVIDDMADLLSGWVGCNPDQVLVLLHESDMKEGDDQGPKDMQKVKLEGGNDLHLPDHLAKEVASREVDEHARSGRPAVIVGANCEHWISPGDRVFLEPDALKFAVLTTFPIYDGWVFVALHGASINFVVNPALLDAIKEYEAE